MTVESFADFVVREVAPDAPASIQKLLHRTAENYINGCPKTAEEIDGLADALEALGKLEEEEESDDGVEEGPELGPSVRRHKRTSQVARIMSMQSGPLHVEEPPKEKFKGDMAVCLTEIIYEYLSRNWQRMDELVCANRRDQYCEQRKSALLYDDNDRNRAAWLKFKKGFFRYKISHDLATIRKMVTMAEILKSIKVTEPPPEVKLAREVLYKAFPPTIVFLGGGMGAGKSTVVSLLKKNQLGAFAEDPLIIEADAMKMIDPVFLKLNQLENGSSDLSQVVHAHSTEAANRQVLAALLQQRTIVMDGTMTWMPFVRQTIDMVRDAHRFQYHLGPGYQVEPDGSVTEHYWEFFQAISCTMPDGRPRLPYKVEMVGVTSDPEKAVARGMRRKLITDRAVPIRGQLRSHRLYSANFEEYLDLFDKVTLYDTSAIGDPQLVAMKEKGQPLLIQPDSYAKFLKKKLINDDASGVEDLYQDGTKIEFKRSYMTDVLKSSFS